MGLTGRKERRSTGADRKKEKRIKTAVSSVLKNKRQTHENVFDRKLEAKREELRKESRGRPRSKAKKLYKKA